MGNALYRKDGNSLVRVRNLRHKDGASLVRDKGVYRKSFTGSLNYGDGSLNETPNGYTNSIYSGGALWSQVLTYAMGNCYNARFLTGTTRKVLTRIEIYGQFQTVYSGLNTYTLTEPTSSSKWIKIFIRAGGMTTGVYVGSLKIEIHGIMHTLKEAVEQSHIEPLVLTFSGANSGPYYLPNFHLIYSGGTTGSGNYPDNDILLKTKEPITAVQFYANRAFNTTYDGLAVYQYLDQEFSLSQWEISLARINT